MLTRCRDIQAETYYLRYLQDGVQCKDADTQFNVQYSSLSSYLLFWLFFLSPFLPPFSFSFSICTSYFLIHYPQNFCFVLICLCCSFSFFTFFLFFLPFSWFLLFLCFKPPSALPVHWPSFTCTFTCHCTIVYSLSYSISKHGRMSFCFCRKGKSPADHWNGCLLAIITIHPLGLLTPGSYWNSNKHITGCRLWESAEIEGSLEQGMTCEVGAVELPWARPCHAAKRCADAARLSLVSVKDDLFQESFPKQVSLFCHLQLAWYEKVFTHSSDCHWLIPINGSLFKV